MESQWISRINRLGDSRTPFFFIIDFEMQHPLVFPLAELDNNSILFNFRGHGNSHFHSRKVNSDIWADFSLNYKAVSRAMYSEAFTAVQDEQRRGNSVLCNLTFPSAVNLPANSGLRDVFHSSSADYKLYIDFAKLGKAGPQTTTGGAPPLPEELLVFSPETFVQTHHGRMYTYPMKGTKFVPDGGSIASAKAALLSDEKEKAEHITVVDLLRNDLGRVGSDIQVEKFRYVTSIPSRGGTLLQASSRISAKMHNNWQSGIGEMLSQLLPAGSVSGAPKRETCRIISESEAMNTTRPELARRGYYCGVAGIFDGWNLDSAVLIRYIENWSSPAAPPEYFFRSGGGITIYSNVEDEYGELIEKIRIPGNGGASEPPA